MKVDNETVRTGGDFLYSDELIFKFTPTEEGCEDLDTCTDHVYKYNNCIYRARPCDECGAIMAIIIDTDANAAETAWNITQEGIVLMSGGPYSVSYGQYNHSECLPFGTYSYNIFDSYGDGLSSCFKNGGFCGHSLAINDKLVLSNDGSFGSLQSQTFGICTTDSHCDDGNACTQDTCDAFNRVCKFDIDCSRCNKVATTIVVDTDLYPYYFSWELSNTESDTIIASMGPLQKAYTHYEHTECLQEGNYIFKAYDTAQDGLTKCYNNNCGYHLSVNGITMFEGGDDNFEEKDHAFRVTMPTSKPKNKKKQSKNKKKSSSKKKKSSSKKKKQSKKKKKTKKKKKAKPSKGTERLRPIMQN